MAKKFLVLAFLVILASSACKVLEIKDQVTLAPIGTANACCDGTDITIDLNLVSGTFAATAQNIKAQIFRSGNINVNLQRFGVRATATGGSTSYSLVYPLPIGLRDPYFAAVHIDLEGGDEAWVGDMCFQAPVDSIDDDDSDDDDDDDSEGDRNDRNNRNNRNNRNDRNDRSDRNERSRRTLKFENHCYFKIDFCPGVCDATPLHPDCPTCQANPNSDECLQFCADNQQIKQCRELCQQRENRYSQFCPFCTRQIYHPLCPTCQNDPTQLGCIEYCETHRRTRECRDPCDMPQNKYNAECPFCLANTYHPRCPTCVSTPLDINCIQYCVQNQQISECQCQPQAIYGIGLIPSSTGSWISFMAPGQTVTDDLVLATDNNVILGSYTITFDGTNISLQLTLNAGVYIARVQVLGGIANTSSGSSTAIIDESYSVYQNVFSAWSNYPVPDADGSSTIQVNVELSGCVWM